MFFATLSGKNTDSALPLLNILEMLTVANVYRLHALKFIHASHKGVLPEPFNHFFQYASNVHNYNTRYAAKQNLHKFRVKTNTGKQMISFMAIDLWQELPYKFKDLNEFAFSKSVKNYSKHPHIRTLILEVRLIRFLYIGCLVKNQPEGVLKLFLKIGGGNQNCNKYTKKSLRLN